MTSDVTFSRDKDGVLVIGPGRFYSDPGEAVKRHWGGNLRFTCTESVYDNYSSKACDNTPKHDPDANGNPTKCGIHSAAYKEKMTQKRAAAQEKWFEDVRRKKALRDAEARIEPALRQIAAGHNDPRTLAQEVLREVDKCRKP